MSKNDKYKLKIRDFLNINSDCNVYWYDLDNNLIEANEHMIKMLKLSYGDHRDILKRSTVIVENIEIILAENKLVIESGEAQLFYNRVKLNGRFYIFVTTKAPYYDTNDKIAGVFGISHLLSSYEVTEEHNEKLTVKERECLMELIKGKTAKQIADLMNLSNRTIESHLENIKGKLGCRNKSELLEKVYQVGLASLAEEPITSEPFKTGFFLPIDKDKK